ncbi:MAG: ABC transporter permease [Gammaproteobacteria bacterium]
MDKVLEFSPSLLQGTVLTIEVALLSLLIAVLLGFLGALAKLAHSRSARFLASAYTTLIRGVPDLVLMFMIFYGGQMTLNSIGDRLGFDYIEINPFVAGVFSLGFIYGAYMTETFRGAILAVPKGQMEAGHAVGMSHWQVFSRILLPQMVRHALPGFGNNWLVLLKGTALVSLIGLHDVVGRANTHSGSTHKPFSFYLAVAVVFLVLTTVSVILMRWADQRYSVGVRQA